jgi:CheY-like chemotaxis protein
LCGFFQNNKWIGVGISKARADTSAGLLLGPGALARVRLRAGMDGYVSKPFRVADLLKEIEALVRSTAST